MKLSEINRYHFPTPRQVWTVADKYNGGSNSFKVLGVRKCGKKTIVDTHRLDERGRPYPKELHNWKRSFDWVALRGAGQLQ